VSDRELLELAAKAGGSGFGGGYFWRSDGIPWNPLTDDGDALRLAVKLGLTVAQLMSGREVLVNDYDETVLIGEFHEADPDAATRRAITRAAAEIGAGLRPFPTAEEIREDWLGGT
jgi:hypothetical protein